MPSNDYTPDNTPPDAVPITGEAPENSAPVGVTVASMDGTANPPVGVPVNDAPDNTEPDPVPVASTDFNNVAPAAVTSDLSPDNTPPDPVPVASTDFNNGAPSGVTVNEAADNTAPDPVPLATFAGTDSAPQQVNAPAATAALSDSNMHTASLTYIGKLTLNQIFGFYKAPAAGVIKGVQLSAQVPPVGADVIIELVDADGVSLARTATLPDGQAYADVEFVTPLPILNAAIVRAKVTQIGVATPGGYLTANLIVQLS